MDNEQYGICDNHSRGKVGDFLRKQITPGSKLRIVSAYFTIYAYEKLKENLDRIDHLNFLFGEPTFLSIDPDRADRREYHITDTQTDISLSNRLQQKSTARECAEWIRNKVSVKSMVKPNFLHGKLYHIQHENGVQKALMGSSNFTVNGLGLGKSPNIELNMIIDSDRDREDLLNWFDNLWNDQTGLIEDVKEQVLTYLAKLYIENEPEFIYFKTLYHLFEKYLDEQRRAGLLDAKIGFFDTRIWNMLYPFQRHGVMGAINKIMKHNGCIIADSVGLGKTFEALAIIKYFELLNKNVLVLCPKKLRDNWIIYTQNDELNPFIDEKQNLNEIFNFHVLNHTDLSRESGKSGDVNLGSFKWGNFDLVVIDESHNFRNNTKGKRDEDGNVIKRSRYERLMQDIIQAGVKTKVLLLSATPVNTSLTDLRNQLYIITGNQDDAFSESIKIASLAHVTKAAQIVFTNWADPIKNPQRSVKDLLEKLDSSFFTLLDEITIARSRKQIKNNYDEEKFGKFPVRLPVDSRFPEIDLDDEFPSYDKLNREIMKYKLSLFNPSAYVKEGYKTLYEEKAGRKVSQFSQERREYFLIGMMKVNFLKRLESSIEAFEISMKRTIEKIKDLQSRIKNLKQPIQDNPEIEFDALTLDEEEDDDIREANERFFIGKKLKFNLAHLNLDLWLADLKEDKDQLISLYNNAKAVTPERDVKLNMLKTLIHEKTKFPLNPGNQKALIFTAFADTAYYLYDSLQDWAQQELGLHIAVVAGGSQENKTTFKPAGFNQQTEFNKILTNFSPISKNREKMASMPQTGEIDILIATDCISEGQNLQDCDYLVNYDIHWNPVRIIQRFGRIDRLGSQNSVVKMVNFWPTEDLNNYINLKDRVESRMALVDLTAAGDDNLLDPDQIQGLITDEVNYRNQQLLKLKEEVLDLEDMDESISFSDFTLDDFRMELSNFLDDHSYRRKIEEAPFGLYAVVPAPGGEHTQFASEEYDKNMRDIIKPGVIFCLRQKGENAGNETVNPLQPFFLVYIRQDGVVRLNYTQAKQILEVFRLLCQGKTKAYESLCDLFNRETQNGENMAAYSELMKKAITQIAHLFKRKNAQNLLGDRSAAIIPAAQKAEKPEDFELITWLILK